MVDIGEKFVFSYAVRGYASGETVTINIYDTKGTKEITAGSMTELTSGLGIYSFNFFPKKRTTYTAVMDCAAKPRQQHVVLRVEQQKLAGAVSFGRQRIPPPVFKESDKKKLFSQLAQIPTEDRTEDILEKLNSIKVENTLPEISKEIAELKKSLIDNKKRSAYLVKNSAEEVNNFYTRNFKKEFDALRKAMPPSNQKELTLLHASISKLMLFSDEAIANVQLANEVFNSDFKDKIATLAANIDEVALLLKNASSNTSNGPPEGKETV